MNLGAVRALGGGTMIDGHGHSFSGAAKMTYIVYMFGKKVSDLDSALVNRGQKYVSIALTRMA